MSDKEAMKRAADLYQRFDETGDYELLRQALEIIWRLDNLPARSRDIR